MKELLYNTKGFLEVVIAYIILHTCRHFLVNANKSCHSVDSWIMIMNRDMQQRIIVWNQMIFGSCNKRELRKINVWLKSLCACIYCILLGFLIKANKSCYCIDSSWYWVFLTDYVKWWWKCILISVGKNTIVYVTDKILLSFI